MAPLVMGQKPAATGHWIFFFIAVIDLALHLKAAIAQVFHLTGRSGAFAAF